MFASLARQRLRGAICQICINRVREHAIQADGVDQPPPKHVEIDFTIVWPDPGVPRRAELVDDCRWWRMRSHNRIEHTIKLPGRGDQDSRIFFRRLAMVSALAPGSIPMRGSFAEFRL